MQSRTDELIAEVERYLRAVEAFRREGCEPCWRSEGAARGKPRKETTCSAS